MGKACLIFVVGFIATVLNNVSAQGQLLQIQTNEGIVTGTIQNQNSRIISFLGVPYAKPPVGELRFKPPQHPDKHNGIQASRSRICPQSDPFNGNAFGNLDEDCLTLDIYIRQMPPLTINEANLKPVLVYLPGGKFRYGGSSTFKADNILDSTQGNKDAILVVVNYRLGLLGFMSTEDEVVPGNMGLHDQSMALHWIANNIQKFGGNQNKVLLFGHDSGAVSVGLHLVSKKSTGVFQRAAMLGGAIENPWAFRHHQARRHAETFASKLNCYDSSSYRMAECLRSKPLDEIVKLQNTYTNISFLPVVDKNFTNDNYLEDRPMELIRKGQVSNRVPMFFGMTSDEGAIDFYSRLNEAKKETLPRSAMSVYLKEYLFPKTVFEDWLNPEEDRAMENIVKGVHYLYFRGVQSSTEWSRTEANWTQMISDYYYKGGLVNMARLWSQIVDANTYLYSLEYPTSLTFGKLGQSTGNNLGVMHMDDIFYYFTTTYPVQESQNDRNIISDLKKKLINLLYEMADQGQPNQNNDLFYTNTPGSTYVTNKAGSVYHNEYARITIDNTNPNANIAKVVPASLDIINSRMDFWTYFVPDVLNNTDTYHHPNTVHAGYASATYGLTALIIILVIMCIALVAVIVVTRRNARFLKVPTKSTENIEIKGGRV